MVDPHPKENGRLESKVQDGEEEEQEGGDVSSANGDAEGLPGSKRNIDDVVRRKTLLKRRKISICHTVSKKTHLNTLKRLESEALFAAKLEEKQRNITRWTFGLASE